MQLGCKAQPNSVISRLYPRGILCPDKTPSNMRKKLYQAITQRLTDQCPDIKHIDLWNVHIAELQATTAFPLPAVFIEYEQFDYVQLGHHAVGANVPIRLHIVTRSVTCTGGSKDKRQAAALQFFDTINDVNKALVTLNGNGFSTFMHTSSVTNHNHADLIESIERYVTRVADLSAASDITPFKAKTDLQIVNEVFG